MRAISLIGFAACSAALVSGCAGVPTSPSELVYQQRGVQVRLRNEPEAAYEHPVQISAERLVQVVGALRVRMPKLDEPKRAVDLEVLPEVVKGLSQGLALSRPGQVVAVTAVRRERRLGLFNEKYLTTFLAYELDGRLHLDFSRVDWKLPKGRTQQNLPVPRHGIRSMRFELETVPPVIETPEDDPQIASVLWRDTAFSMSPRHEVVLDPEESR